MIRTLWKPSPFFRARGNYPLDMIIIHHIGSDAGKLYSISGTITWFTSTGAHKNPQTGAIENPVSAHYAIPRAPQADYDVVQFVKDTDTAYHAGVSQWVVNGKTRNNINNYSIGIELEGDGNLVAYTDFQYTTLTDLLSTLISKYKISGNLIVGHQDIAPTRKVDPGKLFDWDRIHREIGPSRVVASADSPSSTPAPVAVTTAAPQATVPPIEMVPDDQFHMGGGTDKDGRHSNFLASFLKMLTSLFRVS